MPMKLLRIAVIVITCLTTALFGYVYVDKEYFSDETIPVISMPEDVLEVSVDATDEELLAGITAYDEKDGDLTSELMVESIGKFSSTGYCKLTVAVSDSNYHVATATRKIHYCDYESPKFTMTRSLVFSIYDKINFTGIIGATDLIDGDISSSVLIYSADYDEGKEGTFAMQATVTNSKGDIETMVFPVVVEKIAKNAPEITLSKYILYLDEDPRRVPNWRQLIVSMTDNTGAPADLDIEITTDYNPGVKGIFTVDYYGTDAKDVTGHTALLIVVR